MVIRGQPPKGERENERYIPRKRTNFKKSW